MKDPGSESCQAAAASGTIRLPASEGLNLNMSLVLQISLDRRQADKTVCTLVQGEASARHATAFCLFSA